MAYAFNADKSKAEVFTKEEIFNVIYPVGSIYMSVNDVNPETLFGGSWQKIEGRFMLASGSGYNLGGTGGSANASIPSHTHSVSGTVANNGNHTHSVSGTTAKNGKHNHRYLAVGTGDWEAEYYRAMVYQKDSGVGRRQFATSSDSGYYTWSSAKDDSYSIYNSDHTTNDAYHNHTFSANTSQNGQHNHSFNVTSGSTGSSAAGANMPPYLVVNVWKRTA